MDTNNSASIQAGMQDAVKAVLMLRSEMTQREARMSASFNQQMQSLRQELGQFRRDVAGIVDGAGTQIAKQARDAVSPVAAEYDRAVSATSAHLLGASKTVWTWYAGLAVLAVLFSTVVWGVLGYYRRELVAAREALQRYENAVPVVQAFYASDATLCGGRICVNVDPNAQRSGDKRQYRQAKPRPQP